MAETQRTFDDEKAADDFVSKDEWAISYTHKTTDGKKVYFKCKRGASCLAGMFLLYNTEDQTVSLCMLMPVIQLAAPFGPEMRKRLRKKLEEELVHFRGSTFAENTVKTYRTHLTAYLDFCKQLGISPAPVSEREVALFTTFLARRMKPSSVKQYINIVRILHLEAGYGDPFEQSWLAQTTLRGIDREKGCQVMHGIDREKGCQVMRKAPITPDMLLDIKRQLNLALPSDALFWAACMVMFFGLLRKCNLFEPGKQLTRDCFVVEKDQKSIIVLVKSSKNNQFRERVHKVSLPVLAPHPLCPVSAVASAFRLQSTQTPTASAFPLSAAAFARRLRLIVGGRSDISSHSFRRGGATWALSCGVPGEVIKVMGDWKSSAYLVYLDQIPQLTLDYYRIKMCANLPTC